MNRIQIWILAARPKTLGACVSPVLMGGALAYRDGMFHVLAFFTALLASLLIQVGTFYKIKIIVAKIGAYLN